jgi:hypothetical protein
LLQTHGRELLRQNEGARAKMTAYFIRRRRMEIEATICDNIQKKVPVARMMEESGQIRCELLQRIAEAREKMAAEKVEFQKTMAELAQIIEKQRNVIMDYLARELDGESIHQEEEKRPPPDKEEEPMD